ncbi:MAG: (Fe-S)-binding protein [Candidatus Promineifilaceae bacterium]
MSEIDHRIIDDAIWEELIELTGGTAASCYQCGSCTANCPWGLVSEETVSVRSMIREAQLGLPLNEANLWLCTTCAFCEAYCPRGVKISDVILGLRQIAWHDRETPPGSPSLLWSVYWNNNPWSQPPSQRSIWAKKLGLHYYDPAEHDVLLYVGCTSAYDRRAQLIAKAIVHLLRAAEVPFGVLQDDEPCCGEAVLSLGHQLYFQEVSQHAAKILDEKGVRRMVVISPHCYDAFKNQNQFMNGRIEVTHYTSFLAELIDSGQLKLSRPLDGTVTYHDPCYLARHNQELLAPRKILESIPGLNLEEMERSGENTLCCGAGGGRMWMETDPGMRFSDLRVHEAMATGANLMATACPFCLTCLEDSMKGDQRGGLIVKDVAELAALSCAESYD